MVYYMSFASKPLFMNEIKNFNLIVNFLFICFKIRTIINRILGLIFVFDSLHPFSYNILIQILHFINRAYTLITIK